MSCQDAGHWHGYSGLAPQSAAANPTRLSWFPGLALKRRWQERRKKEGKDISKPNIVMGAETHVVSWCTGPACVLLWCVQHVCERSSLLHLTCSHCITLATSRPPILQGI